MDKRDKRMSIRMRNFLYVISIIMCVIVSFFAWEVLVGRLHKWEHREWHCLLTLANAIRHEEDQSFGDQLQNRSFTTVEELNRYLNIRNGNVLASRDAAIDALNFLIQSGYTSPSPSLRHSNQVLLSSPTSAWWVKLRRFDLQLTVDGRPKKVMRNQEGHKGT